MKQGEHTALRALYGPLLDGRGAALDGSAAAFFPTAPVAVCLASLSLFPRALLDDIFLPLFASLSTPEAAVRFRRARMNSDGANRVLRQLGRPRLRKGWRKRKQLFPFSASLGSAWAAQQRTAAHPIAEGLVHLLAFAKARLALTLRRTR